MAYLSRAAGGTSPRSVRGDWAGLVGGVNSSSGMPEALGDEEGEGGGEGEGEGVEALASTGAPPRGARCTEQQGARACPSREASGRGVVCFSGLGDRDGVGFVRKGSCFFGFQISDDVVLPRHVIGCEASASAIRSDGVWGSAFAASNSAMARRPILSITSEGGDGGLMNSSNKALMVKPSPNAL